MSEYSEFPERVQKALDAARPAEQAIEQRIARFSHVRPRAGDGEGDTEIFDAVPFTHHVVDAPGVQAAGRNADARSTAGHFTRPARRRTTCE